MNIFPEFCQKIWRVKPPAPALGRIFAHKLGISPIVAQLLINRGIYTIEQGRAFLRCDMESLHHPLLLKDMDKAVSRILKAVESRERVLVYGDYDADGITGTALLVKVLRRLGAEVEYFIPNRLEEGYGLHLEVLKKAMEKGTSLVVTVDCGISDMEEVCWAGKNGIDLIITDHHEPPGEIPPALAAVNPKRHDCIYPFKELAGVGVALKLAQALFDEAGVGSEAWKEYLDLACLGTIADIVPVKDENRILVKYGLPILSNTGNPGLRALMAVSGTDKGDLGTSEVSFGLAPRLNAAGRMGRPELALRLLLTDSIEEARELAVELNNNNQARQKIESVVLAEALALVNEVPELVKGLVLVLASDNWHPGVVGIVASRLMERLYRPVLLISMGELEGRGSARSIPEFNIYHALDRCRENLLDYGGHSLAAGFSIKRTRIDAFRKDINALAEQLIGEKKLMPGLELDGIIDLEQVSEELVREISTLRPFGHTNPDPLLGCRKALLLDSRCVGKKAAHLKLRLQRENTTLEGIGFNMGPYAGPLAAAKSVDLAFVPGINEYNGRRSIQLEVKDLGIPAVLEQPGRVSYEEIQPDRPALVPDDILQGDTQEYFMPEFVLGKLNVLNNTDSLVCIKCNKEKHQINFIDKRGLANRPEELAELVSGDLSTMVITTGAYQTVELACHLQLARPSLKGRVACCHSINSHRAVSEMTAMFKAGKVKVMVTTPSTAGFMGKTANQSLLYHLPYSTEAIYHGINSIQTGGNIYLLFGPEDLEDNEAGLETLAPGRDFLACFYKMLRRQTINSGWSNISVDQTLKYFVNNGFHYSSKYTVRAALSVLDELALLTSEWKGEYIRFRLRPAPLEKKDLFQAQTFRQLHLLKEETITFMRKFLSEPLHNLLSIIGFHI